MTMKNVGRLFASKLPLLIKKARARAVEHPQLFLKGKVTALVQVLITYTNLDDIGTPLRFNRERPATLLGVSTRTIDRLLKELESLGWLARLPQPRLKDGNWGCTSIAWSAWVIKDVFALPPATDKWGTPTHKTSKTTAPNPKTLVNRATKTAHLSFSPKGEVFQNKVENDNSHKSTETAFDPFNERMKNSRRIPVDLVEPMKALKLSAQNICLLMAHCKRKGKRLQDVFLATLDQLKQRRLLGQDALGWLMYMIGLERDYAYESRQKQNQAQQKQRTAKRTALLQRLADIALRPGATLPNGMVVGDRINGMVTLSQPGSSRFSGAPELPLMESLCKAHLSWARKILRGKFELPTISMADTDTSTCVSSTRERLNDRRVILQNLADMKSMLKASRSFAKVGYAA